tara:strand:- start:9 stop:218 length:210 start_codon:yes stop_codon:yes gene_type:complete
MGIGKICTHELDAAKNKLIETINDQAVKAHITTTVIDQMNDLVNLLDFVGDCIEEENLHYTETRDKGET